MTRGRHRGAVLHGGTTALFRRFPGRTATLPPGLGPRWQPHVRSGAAVLRLLPVHLVLGVVIEAVVGQVGVGVRGRRLDVAAVQLQAVREHGDALGGEVRLHHRVGELQHRRAGAAVVGGPLFAPVRRVHVDLQAWRATRATTH